MQPEPRIRVAPRDLRKQFDYVSSIFSEEWENVEGIPHDPAPISSMFVHHFKRQMTSKKVIAWADKNGYRVATHEEAVDFAKAQPDLQREFPIVALGSFSVNGGYRYVAVLCGHDAERGLGFDWFGSRWLASYRFLLVRNLTQ